MDQVNDPEKNQDFRANYRLYENQFSASYQFVSQDDQKYINNNHRATSLYIAKNSGLIIYDSEKEREEIKICEPREALDDCKYITQLPNDELFCFGNINKSGIAYIIDSNFKARALPSGGWFGSSTGIYFNNNIYCFGVQNIPPNFSLSKRFDMNENRWVNLTSLQKIDILYHSVTFNENILISGYYSGDLLLYNIAIDSFSRISYTFSRDYKRKILVNAERLYAIECGGWIYKGDDEYHWQKLVHSTVYASNPSQACCLYNKGGIYIAIWCYGPINYYKFDLNKEVMIRLN